MTSPKAVLKSVGPKLVPFFKTVAIYFVLFLPNANPSYFACLIKCLPVVSLCVFVLLHGMNLRDEYAYSRRILGGLLFSCLGDAFLLYPHYFLQGMACFGIAHILYTSAFGFHPFNPYAGTFCLVITAAASYILLPAIENSILMTCVSIYIALIGVMVWRAIARVQLFEDLWTWTKLCSCAGGIFFCTSDAIIGIDHFLFPIPYSQALVMVSYYAAQFGIALSVVDSMAVTNEKNNSKAGNNTKKVCWEEEEEEGKDLRCTTRSRRNLPGARKMELDGNAQQELRTNGYNEILYNDEYYYRNSEDLGTKDLIEEQVDDGNELMRLRVRRKELLQ